ncbi:hypothetical protein EN741_24925 [Mesorhizobium sp. M4B.F.Ca.ET.019.03.1.1]|uniref:hypothetical protein n=1 Tax=Mesorhizobium sp. M4B.F.Ca.ET.019.03.1.1 TaxID=2496651 RepID=UPI000FCA6137|nr:hypothetical protein [Mesorhizobium sp. M4B.F.Ca.ET.019.03.1.1]RVD36782.1 hypothetical protein EN741_24925 [Mesorhizobium sp. M4B.F.Ca.ET.019.03.1.1]
MTVPSHWPTHWRRAVAGDHSGLTDFDDSVQFFLEANNRCPHWRQFSDAERDVLVELSYNVSDRLKNAYSEAMGSMIYDRSSPEPATRFIGNLSTSRGPQMPTHAELAAEIAGIEREIASMPKPDPWAAAIAKTNAKLGL